MIEVTLFIPITDNQGMTFTPNQHAEFESFVLERFGGLSRQTQPVEGVWTDGQTTYRDSNLVYIIAITSITDGGTLGEVIEFAKRHYEQEALFVRYLGIAEVL